LIGDNIKFVAFALAAAIPFIVPYFGMQYLPQAWRRYIWIFAFAVLAISGQPLRRLPHDLAVVALPLVMLLCLGILAGAAVRAFGPRDGETLRREYLWKVLAVGLPLALVALTVAAMSTDGL
jgi:hypothetical protein